MGREEDAIGALGMRGVLVGSDAGHRGEDEIRTM